MVARYHEGDTPVDTTKVKSFLQDNVGKTLSWGDVWKGMMPGTSSIAAGELYKMLKGSGMISETRETSPDGEWQMVKFNTPEEADFGSKFSMQNLFGRDWQYADLNKMGNKVPAEVSADAARKVQTLLADSGMQWDLSQATWRSEYDREEPPEYRQIHQELAKAIAPYTGGEDRDNLWIARQFTDKIVKQMLPQQR